MAKYIWRLINVGFWKETTRGTAVTVSKWIAKTNMSFDNKIEKIMDESSLWIITTNSNAYKVKEWAEGNIEQNIWIESIALPLLSLMWSVSSAETSWTGAYTHTFSLTNSNQHQSLTIWVKDEVEDYQFSLWMIESITINAEVGGFATVSMDFKAKKGTTASQTVSNIVDYKLLAKSWIFKIADNLSWLNSATAKCIKSFEITISKNLEEDYCLWSTEPTDFINKNLTIEWSFVAVYQNETDYKNTVFSDNTKALRLSLIDTDQTIWVSDNPTLIIDLAKASFTEWEKTQWNDEIVTQTVTFNWMYSIADSSTIDISLINETASY